MKTAIRNSIICMGLALAGCGSSATPGSEVITGIAGKSASAVVAAAVLPDGAAVYAGNCAGCHGALTSSTKIGADSIRNQNAITGNIGGMGFLSTLTATDIQAISDALAPVSTGAALYKSSCLACHGGLSTTSKAGADVVRTQSAIASNAGGMGFLSTLSPLQLQAISSTLAAAPAGAALYASNCAGCHGAIITSAKIGADFSRIQNAINNNSGGMGVLSTLTAAYNQAIAAVLSAP